MSMAMMAITTSSSISVKARYWRNDGTRVMKRWSFWERKNDRPAARGPFLAVHGPREREDVADPARGPTHPRRSWLAGVQETQPNAAAAPSRKVSSEARESSAGGRNQGGVGRRTDALSQRGGRLNKRTILSSTSTYFIFLIRRGMSECVSRKKNVNFLSCLAFVVSSGSRTIRRASCLDSVSADWVVWADAENGADVLLCRAGSG